ncbi:hypothetical protein F4824DRAFT_504694 [Ustulina deusta]|nr:hypothetical protein F4824DRAFT_504694 [Ustulina deusta]
MLGDAADLMAILCWASNFWEFELVEGDANPEGERRREYIFSSELRHEAGDLAIDLVGCFENVEKKCRKDHGLAASKRKQLSEPKRCCIVNGGSAAAVQLLAKYSWNLTMTSLTFILLVLAYYSQGKRAASGDPNGAITNMNKEPK